MLAVDLVAGDGGEGSGFFIGPGGLAVTALHVVGTGAGRDDENDDGDDFAAARWAVLSDGRRVPLYVEAVDGSADLALVRVHVGPGSIVRSVTVGERVPEPGEAVRTLTGAGVNPARVLGLVDEETRGELIELAVEGIGPGASGGAVVDDAGRVVGVILGESDAGVALAVPAARMRAMVK